MDWIGGKREWMGASASALAIAIGGVLLCVSDIRA